MSQLTQRFQNIFQLQDHYFEIIGCGAIGSYAAMNLARAGATKFELWDPDTVDPVNIGVQHYDLTHIGNSKVKMLSKQMSAINPNVEIDTFRQKFNANTRRRFWHSVSDEQYREKKVFIIIGIDNMEGRKQIVEDIISLSKTHRYPNYYIKGKYTKYYTFIIDGRMGSETFQMYHWELIPDEIADSIKRKREEINNIQLANRTLGWNNSTSEERDANNNQIDNLKMRIKYLNEQALRNFQANYLETWYSDEDGDSEPCNARSTNYCASMAGAFINNQVRKLVDPRSPSNTNLVFNFPAMALKCDTNYNLNK